MCVFVFKYDIVFVCACVSVCVFVCLCVCQCVRVHFVSLSSNGTEIDFIFLRHPQLFSDPSHTLRNYLEKQGWLNIRISFGEKYEKLGPYPNGLAQPGVLCMKSDKTILYQWAIIPAEVRSHPQALSSWNGLDLHNLVELSTAIHLEPKGDGNPTG